MYVISRTIKIEKEYSKDLISKFDKPSIVFNFEGFVRREGLVNQRHKGYDVVTINTYFLDKEAYIRWEKSPEHLAMHKKSDQQQTKKPEGIIDVEANYYDLVLEQSYREKTTE